LDLVFNAESGLPDFLQHTKSGKFIQNNLKMYQMATKYTKGQKNRPNGHTIYQHLPLQEPPKFTQFGISGLKIFHLATLLLIGV
jgi:hypothetical protein